MSRKEGIFKTDNFRASNPDVSEGLKRIFSTKQSVKLAEKAVIRSRDNAGIMYLSRYKKAAEEIPKHKQQKNQKLDDHDNHSADDSKTSGDGNIQYSHSSYEKKRKYIKYFKYKKFKCIFQINQY